MNNTNNHSITIRLGVDLDGVIYNFVDEFRAYIANRKNVSVDTLPEPSKWDFHSQWDLTDEEYLREVAIGAIHGELFTNGSVYEGAQEGMSALRDLGFEIVIVTARHVSNNPNHMTIIRENTEAWLANNNIPYDELIINNDKTRHGLVILVDDDLANIEAMLRTGNTAYVFDRPWNRANPFYDRIENWEDFVLRMQDFMDNMNAAINKFGSAVN